jgi:pimeloyl-ACP methyl ester carboxylesterase
VTRRPIDAPSGCIKAFSETDLTEDLRKIDVPTLVLHGSDDQIVPIADSAMLSSKIVRDAKLVVIDGAPHGLCTTHKDRMNGNPRSRADALKRDAAIRLLTDPCSHTSSTDAGSMRSAIRAVLCA